MAAVSADQIIRSRNEHLKKTVVASIKTASTVYVGTLAMYNTSGRVLTGAAAASSRFAGLVEEIINESGSAVTAGTGNTAGTIKAKISYGHEVWLAVLTAARTYANLGKSVCIGDNVSVTDATGAGTAGVRVVCGTLEELTDSKAKGWVALRNIGDASAA